MSARERRRKSKLKGKLVIKEHWHYAVVDLIHCDLNSSNAVRISIGEAQDAGKETQGIYVNPFVLGGGMESILLSHDGRLGDSVSDKTGLDYYSKVREKVQKVAREYAQRYAKRYKLDIIDKIVDDRGAAKRMAL